jgi:hypothetical protein
MDEERWVPGDTRDCYTIKRNSVKDGIEAKITFMALLRKTNFSVQ